MRAQRPYPPIPALRRRPGPTRHALTLTFFHDKVAFGYNQPPLILVFLPGFVRSKSRFSNFLVE